jgi:hypothetical protein
MRLLLLHFSHLPDPDSQIGRASIFRALPAHPQARIPPHQPYLLKCDFGGHEDKRLRLGSSAGHNQRQRFNQNPNNRLLPCGSTLQAGLQTA